jgi:hypothetical protein
MVNALIKLNDPIKSTKYLKEDSFVTLSYFCGNPSTQNSVGDGHFDDEISFLFEGIPFLIRFLQRFSWI